MLFLSNNRIKDWSEVERLAAADQLEELLLVGNPLYNEYRDTDATPEYRVEVCVPVRLSRCVLSGCLDSVHMLKCGHSCCVCVDRLGAKAAACLMWPDALRSH